NTQTNTKTHRWGANPAEKKSRQYGANPPANLFVVAPQLPNEPEYETEDQRPYQESWNASERAQQRPFEPHFSLYPKIVECRAVQPECHKDNQQAADYTQSKLDTTLFCDTKPIKETDHQQSVRDYVYQPDALAVDDRPERLTFEALHARSHLTSSFSGSLVAKYEGWYIGSTLAGLTRNTPGFTTF